MSAKLIFVTTVVTLLMLLEFLCPAVSGAKILIFVPGLSNSQLVFNYRVGDLLASNGHDVTMYRPQYDPDVKKMKTLTKELHFKAVANDSLYREFKEKMSANTFVDDFGGSFSMARSFSRILADACETQITDKKLMKQLKDAEFDLAIGHMYDFCPLGMIKALNIPTYIWMSSGTFVEFMAWAVGAPTPASVVPVSMASYTDRMTFFQRIKNTLGQMLFHTAFHFIQVNPYNELFRRHFGKDFMDVMEIGSKSPLLFINSDEFIDFPRPILHKVVYIGGIGLTNPNPLKEDWQSIMDNSQDGVVLFSFGSVAKPETMPQSWKDAFLDAFSKFPTYTFVWKYDKEFKAAEKVKNVVISKWVPQNDMFGHPKMKAFITHAGFNSLMEASYSGIPLILIPLFGDQSGNRARAERQGIGIGIDKSNVDSKHIVNALTTILKNSTYKENSVRLSKMIKKKPVKGEDLVVRWVDFLAEFKQLPNLAPVSSELSLVEYFLVDVFAVLALGALLLIYIIIFVFRFLFKKICGKATSNKSKYE